MPRLPLPFRMLTGADLLLLTEAERHRAADAEDQMVEWGKKSNIATTMQWLEKRAEAQARIRELELEVARWVMLAESRRQGRAEN